MSNTINFLETIGQHAQLRHARRAELYSEMSNREIDNEEQWAILSGDTKRLEVLLAAPAIVCCGMEPAEDDEPSRDDDDEEVRLESDRVAIAA